MKRLHTVWFIAILFLVAATGSVAVARTTHRTTWRTVRVALRREPKHTTVTTLAPTTTSDAPTTTTPTTASPPTTVPPPETTPTTAIPTPTTTPTVVATGCKGTPMPSGQADINANPQGTTFCMSGTHNWTLTPKSGDTLVGPATLDGANSASYAVVAASGVNNVTLSRLEIRNYIGGNAIGAIHAPDPPSSTGWTLDDLQVHDIGNGTTSGAGAELGVGWHVVGGRYFNTRQEGLTAGGGAHDIVVDGAELDHNNFTNDAYTTRSHSCGDEAGGFKLVADNVTIKNASVHDNACKGLWTDINSNGTVITNNLVYNNWDEGILLEISSNATVSGNTVYGNGWHNYNGDGSGCPWLFGGGISLNSSDHANIFNNNVYGNCNGITGVQQDRPDGRPGLLEYVSVHDNMVAGPAGTSGAAEDNGANLSTRSITFTSDGFANGMNFCALSC
jgi:parallel beta-helix repeat protein